ncbi:D-alanyl-D-alanine carboxypeptidase family protein [Haloimpatiens massiliensis]|uniref:D-alanyl-D-alanine carboxypeptidase family protein n=1 Tax=Haloimpatiens massiliensis TaxID=1658110 RepID=UPI000C85ADAB|nr:D-alanyl-D-alanine carboxypeptidase family protein [Haloimpatiens massiliensis]
MKLKRFSLVLVLTILISSCSSVFAKTNTEVPPTIHGSAAVTLDMETGEIIYAKDVDGTKYSKSKNTKGMYPASVTKLMTALIFAENKDKLGLNTLKYNKSAEEQPEYSLRINFPTSKLKKGDSIPAKDVMNSLLLFSANDMAYVIAGNVGKTTNNDENSKKAVDNFINMMNKEASKLHMKNTHFVTANGLHDAEHYTTPYDLSLLGRAALKNNWIAETMKSKKSSMSINGVTIPLENRNKLVGETVNGAICIGGKTGYTSNAGRCLLAIFEKDGRKILGVVMNSIYDAKDTFVFEDMKKIINWSYNAKRVNYLKKDSVIGTETLKYKPLKFFGPEKSVKVPLILKEDVNYYDNEVNSKEISKKIDAKNLSLKTLTGDKPVAKLVISQREATKSFNLYTNISKTEIIKSNLFLYLIAAAVVIAVLVLIISLIFFIKNLINKKRRPRYWS